MKATLTMGGQTFHVEPAGIGSLVSNQQKSDKNVFFRQKSGGSITFMGADFDKVSSLAGCCSLAILTVYDCSVLVGSYKVKSEKIEWNFADSTATVSDLTIDDDYTGVLKLYEKKINVLKLAADLSIYHAYTYKGKSITNPDETIDYVGSIDNKRFRTFNAFVLFIIQQTFKNTPYNYLIPTTVAYSTFFTSATNPVDRRPNLFLRSAIAQASDVCYPESDQSATAILQNGKENESMCISLKQILDTFYAMFDCSWHVDPVSRTFRIEHRLFYANGNSYQSPNVGLDFRLSRFANVFKSFSYNYKTRTDLLFGVEELILTGNQSLNNSDLAFDLTYKKSEDEKAFGRVDDFEYGNIKYDYECIGRDEKDNVLVDTRSADLFYTMLDSIQYNDNAIDKTKWFLVEYGNNTTTSTTGVLGSVPVTTPPPRGGVGYTPPASTTTPTQTTTTVTTTKLTFVKGYVERRNADGITNHNFTATALMRNFHRHGRAFGTGLMNYYTDRESIGGTIRQMYSVNPSKLYQPLVVVGWQADEVIDPYAFLTLPNGERVRVDSVQNNRSTDTMTLNLIGQSSCGGAIVPVPAVATDSVTGKFPVKGQKLRTESFQVNCVSTRGTDLGTRTGTRTFYTDGLGGEYSLDSNPCQTNETPYRGPR